MKTENLDRIDIINDTNEKFAGVECVNIGSQKVWKRKCPDCNGNIVSKDKWYSEDANRKRRLCKSCRVKKHRNPNYGKHVSEDRKRKWNITYYKNNHIPYWTGRVLGEVHRNNISISKRGIFISPDHIACIRKANIGNSYRKGILHSKETKIKLRIAKANYAMRNAGSKICPAFNEDSCKYFSILNEEMHWNGRYATNGGEYFVKELGYWVDYYEPTENVVIEWDERRHYKNGRLTDKDCYRMEEIQKLLGCKFYRINAAIMELVKYKDTTKYAYYCPKQTKEC